MNALMNHATRTVHRKEAERETLRAVCGATTHVDTDHLSETTLSKAVEDARADKCGRCFDDGGGY